MMEKSGHVWITLNRGPVPIEDLTRDELIAAVLFLIEDAGVQKQYADRLWGLTRRAA